MADTWLWRTVAAVGLAFIFFPGLDLGFSRLFYQPGFSDPSLSFVWRGVFLVDVVHWMVVAGSYLLAAALVTAFLIAAIRLRPFLGLGTRQWLFLALAMAIGPGLMVNLVFKEYWERARPAQIEEFGGHQRFSPPMVVSNQCHHNCSFVCGEASAGFFLHSFTYVARRRRREIFVGGLVAGLLIGFMRVAQGAHFLSDVLYAGAVIVASTAAVHALIYGRAATVAWWRTHILTQPTTAG